MNFIEKLAEEAQPLVQSLKNKRFKGLKDILTDIYHEDAHFIYELLQNAEDVKATKVSFKLTHQHLEFQHNGNAFTEKNVESINSIGDSTKKDDPTQIGTFGVGFKAVFSYTDTPRIYCGKWAFEIHDLVCPLEIPQILEPNDTSTKFVFPFNHSQKTPEKAAHEISQALLALPANTILFLQNIKEIYWEIGTENGFIKLAKLEKANHFEIERKTTRLEKTSWLRFSKEITIIKNNEPQKSFIAIAFKLEKRQDANEFIINNKIDKGDVAIFFPAEKETSNLKFFLHAPFSATVARNSIPNRPENDELRDSLVELLVESLPLIKELGLLNLNFLSILPINSDSLSNFYSPFRDGIVKAFQTQNLTPTWKNEFLPAKFLLQSNDKIKKVINKDSILSYIVDDEKVNDDFDWAVTPEGVARVSAFLETLKIQSWNWETLLKKVSKTFSEQSNADSFLSNVSDEWMRDFYELLGEAKQATTHKYWGYQERIENACIVRLENGNLVAGKGAYFQTDFIKNSKDIKIVKAEVYKSHSGKILNEKATAFLKLIGVEEFKEKDEILAILNENYSADGLRYNKERNIRHIEKFVNFWKSNQREADIFSEYKFLRCENKDPNNHLCEPNKIYIDNPFESTELSSVDKFLSESRLWNGYENELKNKSDFIVFLKAVGIVFKLQIKETSVWNNPAWQKQRTSDGLDYTISNLREMLETRNRQISKLIWKTIIDVDKRVFRASCYGRETHSQLILTLRDIDWVPDIQGNFHRPQEMTRELLPDDFPFDNRNGWLDEKVLGFGSETKKRIETAQRNKNRKESLAREVGFNSVEQMEKAIELFMSPEKLARYEKFEQQEEIKERNLQKLDRKSSHFDNSETHNNFSPRPRNIEIRERSVVDGYGNLKANEARPFLKQQYFEDRELICQVCQEEMPFKTLNSEYFFVAVKIIEKTIEDHIANYLCCCPNCAAMFQYANKYKENMAEFILQGEEYTRGYFLPFELSEMSFDIHFTKKHFEQLLRFAGEINVK